MGAPGSQTNFSTSYSTVHWCLLWYLFIFYNHATKLQTLSRVRHSYPMHTTTWQSPIDWGTRFRCFKVQNLNYTAAITTRCPHFFQIVLQNNLTRKYPWQPKIRDSVSFLATETCEYSNSYPIKFHNILLHKVIFSKIS